MKLLVVFLMMVGIGCIGHHLRYMHPGEIYSEAWGISSDDFGDMIFVSAPGRNFHVFPPVVRSNVLVITVIDSSSKSPFVSYAGWENALCISSHLVFHSVLVNDVPLPMDSRLGVALGSIVKSRNVIVSYMGKASDLGSVHSESVTP